MSDSFFISDQEQPHPERARRMLAAHPEVRALMGRNPATAFVLVALVALQLGLAYVFGQLGWSWIWLALIAAYGIGAFVSHGLFVVIHDLSHNLVFRRRIFNKLAMIVADLPNVVPSAAGFGIFHIQHHARQGEYGHDADLPSAWEVRLVGNRWYMKVLWLLFFPVMQLARPVRVRAYKVINRWTVLNAVVAIAIDVTVLVWFGPCGLVYLVASLFFGVGLHPLGGRWIQEHFTLDPAQETFSYYGPLNRLSLNVGYHTEHHDFPSIPWNRLPELRRLCPEFYDTQRAHHSWTGLLLRFIFDPAFSLHSRVIRERT